MAEGRRYGLAPQLGQLFIYSSPLIKSPSLCFFSLQGKYTKISFPPPIISYNSSEVKKRPFKVNLRVDLRSEI